MFLEWRGYVYIRVVIEIERRLTRPRYMSRPLTISLHHLHGRGNSLRSHGIGRHTLLLVHACRSLCGSAGHIDSVTGLRGKIKLLLFLRLQHGNDVRLGDGASGSALRIVRKHNLNLNTEHTLLELDVAGGLVDVVVGGVTGGDHVSVLELHRLGTLGTQLTGNDDFATLGLVLHDEAENAVASAADGDALHKLVAKGLGLSHSAEPTVLYLLGVEGNGSLGHIETLLDKRGKLADAPALLADDVLRAGGLDDDLSAADRSSNLDTRVSILSQLAGEELVELGVEDTVLDELLFLGDVGDLDLLVGLRVHGRCCCCYRCSLRLQWPP
mmetsp:Transcript_12834/g.23324  ORF Transcript_12834/g.23324 Transcript_12834/m.23324 type:complete len:327 (+) Transcript_12834:172-1152(+)